MKRLTSVLFYISTYACHGFRYLIDPSDYLFPKMRQGVG